MTAASRLEGLSLNALLNEPGSGIQWIQSYVTADKLFCVFLSEDERRIRTHAERSGFPATLIRPVRTLIDPTTAPV